MFSCVLRPLRSHLEKALVELHNQDGTCQRLTKNLLHLKGDAAMERLGVRTGVPDSRGVERVKQKLVLMQRTHSPIDKVLLLLQVCKCVHKAMGSLHGETKYLYCYFIGFRGGSHLKTTLSTCYFLSRTGSELGRLPAVVVVRDCGV